MHLVERLIGEETIRYFDFLIEDHNLPPVPDNHRPHLVEAAMQVARHRLPCQAVCLAQAAVAGGLRCWPRAPLRRPTRLPRALPMTPRSPSGRYLPGTCS
ncbi:hypothetical protein AB0J28_43465 [Streptosporangium canum]|uniref:hypothetical protein n=1 Tax=Streptosporangium canum TaxID=324952 RepID=UPI0034422366